MAAPKNPSNGPRNVLSILRQQVLSSKRIPPEVKRHIERMFQDVHLRLKAKGMEIRELDDATASPEAHRIAIRLNWLRAQHQLNSMHELDTGFMQVSKVAAHWLSIESKLGKRQRGQRDEQQRKRMPIPRRAEPESTKDEGGQADA